MNKIVLFGGKGGVGKTTCSVAYSVYCASIGKKTLLVSTDPAHSTSDIFEKKIGDEIVNIYPNLDALEINGEVESKKYMDNVRIGLKNVISPIIVKEINKQINAAAVSPGTEEAALFDKMIEIIVDKSKEYDQIIFDTAPTGHTVRLLSLPELLGAWIDSLMEKRRKSLGLMQMAEHHGKNNKEEIENDEVIKILKRRYERIKAARKMMVEDKLLSFIFVLNAEKLAIDETKKAVNILEQYGILVERLIVNKILPAISCDDFWISKKEQEKAYLELIKDTFKNKEIFHLPLLKTDMKSNNINDIAELFRDGFI